MIGIYYIYSKKEDKYYVGKSKDIKARMKKHLSDLKLNKHHSPYLQHTYNKYGLKDLEFKIIQECSYEESGELEKYYIEKYNSFKNGFNCTLEGEWGCARKGFFRGDFKKNYLRM